MNIRELLLAPPRRALHEGAARWPWFRRIVSIGARELERALHDELYTEGQMSNEFHRTVSRIIEMQSREYLESPRRTVDTSLT